MRKPAEKSLRAPIKSRARRPRKAYTRAPAAVTARDIGWNGARDVTMAELCRMAGVGYCQLRKDRVEHGLLAAPLPKKPGVRTPIWSASAVRRYLRVKNPAALNF